MHNKFAFKNIYDTICLHLNNSIDSIQIAVAWFTNEDLMECLCKRLEANIKVELILIRDLINCNENSINFQRFIDLGGRLYWAEANTLMHHKFCIIDKKTLINGSYNWTYYAEYKNMENIVIRNDIETTYAFNSEFNNIVQRLSLCETYKTIRPEEITAFAYKIPFIYIFLKTFTFKPHL